MGGESLLVPVAAGNGGIREMQEAVDDATVQFGLVRFELGSGQMRRRKILFLHFNGLNCPALTRGRANEYLSDAKTALDSGGEGFHASVEVKEKAEVTTESIVSRVSKFFITDDEANYSVKWMLDRYEQFVSESSQKNGHSLSSPDASRNVSTPGHHSLPLFASGRDALKSVAGPSGPWNWVFVKADPEALPLVSGGHGSVDEMRACMEQNQKEVMFGLLRMGFGVDRLRRIKHVFVQAIGKEVPAFQRGRLSNTRPKMEAALKVFALSSVALEITEPADFTAQEVIDRVRQAAVIDDDAVDPDNAGKNIFSVEHYRAALKEEMRMQAVQEEEANCKRDRDIGDRPAEEIARLVRLPDGELNWAIFSLSASAQKVRAVLQKRSSLMPTGPAAPYMPHGGYAAASVRARSQAPPAAAPSVTPAAPATSVRARARSLAPAPHAGDQVRSVAPAVTPPAPAATPPVRRSRIMTEVAPAVTPPAPAATLPVRRSRIMTEVAPAVTPPALATTPPVRRSRILTEAVSNQCIDIVERRARTATIGSLSPSEDETLSFNSRVRLFSEHAKVGEESRSQPRARVLSMALPSSPVESESVSSASRPRAVSGFPEIPEINISVTTGASTAPCWGLPLANTGMRLLPKPSSIQKQVGLGRPRLAGALLKQSPGLLHRWQLRHFEIGSGKLKWWGTLREKQDGHAPKNEVDLEGLCVQPISATRFTLQTALAGKVYVLDADAQSCVRDDAVYDSMRWVQALQQEATTHAVLAQQSGPGVA